MDTFATIQKNYKAEVRNLIMLTIQDSQLDYQEFDVTCDRLGAMGAVDALKLVAIELGYSEAELWDWAEKIEDTALENFEALGEPKSDCRHYYYSTSPDPIVFGGEEATANRCDNCNSVVSVETH